MNRAIIAVALAGLTLAAVGCGSDGDSDATVQEQLASAAVDQLEKVDGVEADEACVSDAAASLSDADAQALLDNLDADPSTLSEEQQAFLDATGACISLS
jgi:ribosome assembly protein YihI (activator of Der GTPase)